MFAKYIIDRRKCLGSGATADVFLGMCLDDGSQFAFKCSKERLVKEVLYMKNLVHKNIIQYYDNLTNFEGYEQVIVMEYCNKGSLFEFSELHRGLCDNMFMKVLECLNLGVAYLRSKDIIHRDIKPGNMMVHQDSMGYFEVKLGDMGTAKKVADNQNFMSLVGTEEYLHPDMYITYLQKIRGNFTVKVDLWSIGVTFYHSVVTQLPFIPYQYSRASKTAKRILRQMYVDKKSGIISGKQNSEGVNDITWSDKLPDTCRLSPMLKDMSSKLIGNLMDLTEINSYERFFDEANSILRKKRVLVFNSMSAELQIIYLKYTNYISLRDQISKIVILPNEEIIILTRNKQVKAQDESNAESLRSWPIRGEVRYALTDDTVLVIPSKLKNRQLHVRSLNSYITSFDKPSDTFITVENIKKFSYDLIKAIYQVSYSANYIDCQIDCYLATVFSFNEHILKPKLLLMKEALPWQMKAIRDLCIMTKSLVTIVEHVIKDTDDYTATHGILAKCKDEIEQLRNKGLEGEKCAEHYYSTILEKQQMLKLTERYFCSKDAEDTNDNLDFLVHLAEELVNELKLMPMDDIISDVQYKLQIWQRQIKLWKYFDKSKNLLLIKNQSLHQKHMVFNKWLSQGLSVMDHVDGLCHFLSRLDERRLALRTKFLQISDFLLRVLRQAHLGDDVQPSIINLEGPNSITYRIMELKELTEKMKNKFCGARS